MGNYFCPVCGYKLDYESWVNESPSDEICPSCGIQFGYHDAIRFKGTDDQIRARYSELRQKWIDAGMPWADVDNPLSSKPFEWSPQRQLLNIGIEL